MPSIITRGAMSLRSFGFASGNSYTYRWAFDTTGASSFVVPPNVYFMQFEAIAAGGGVVGATGGNGSGGGGAYAMVTLPVTPGNTVYYNVGAGAANADGGDSWVNISANSAPASSANGVLAKGGSKNSGTAGGAGGSAASSIGSVVFSGGAGGSRGSVSNSTGGSGGSGGPGGNGGSGGDGTSSGTAAGGGGGSAGGALSTNGSTATSGVGGAGGSGPAGGSGGTGATSVAAATLAAAGSGGGGGGGSAAGGGAIGGGSRTFDVWGGGYGPGSGYSGNAGAGGALVNLAYGGGTRGLINTQSRAGGPGLIVVSFSNNSSSFNTFYVSNYLSTVPNSKPTNFVMLGTDSSMNTYFLCLITPSSFPSGPSIGCISKNGNLLWQRTITSSTTLSIRNGFLDSSQNVYVTGTDSTSLNFIMKYNSSGVLQWQRTFTDSVDLINWSSIFVDVSGNVFIFFADGTNSSNLNLVKYSSSGSYIGFYTSTIPSCAPSLVNVAYDSSGYFYVSVSGNSGATNYNYMYKYDTSLNAQWGVADSGNGGANVPCLLGLSLYSTSVYWGFYDAANGHPCVASFSSSGTLQWTKQITTQTVLTQNNQGSFCVDYLGDLYIGLQTTNVSLWKIDSTGTVKYFKSFGGFASSSIVTNPIIVGTSTVSVGAGSSVGPSIITAPASGLAAGNYGPINVTDVSATYSSSSITTSSTPPAWSSSSITDSAGTLTDSAASGSVMVGWI